MFLVDYLVNSDNVRTGIYRKLLIKQITRSKLLSDLFGQNSRDETSAT